MNGFERNATAAEMALIQALREVFWTKDLTDTVLAWRAEIAARQHAALSEPAIDCAAIRAALEDARSECHSFGFYQTTRGHIERALALLPLEPPAAAPPEPEPRMISIHHWGMFHDAA